MNEQENNFMNSEPLKTKLDTLTALIVVVFAVLALTLGLLWLSHDSNSECLDIIEKAIQLSEVAK
jgi:preprotein translocase subunit SecG